MKKRLVYSLGLLFLLFSIGAGLTMLYTYRITRDLESVINLHRIEIIRQSFVINIQTVQSNLYATGTIFGKELDTIVDNVSAMDDSIHSCKGCHHNKDMTERLNNVDNMVQQYKEAISYLVTSTANEERIERLKMVAVGIGDSLLFKTQEMAAIADKTLRTRTFEALKAINKSRIILLVTLVTSLLLALGIAVTLTRQITRPVSELVNAARMITAGRLGYKTEYTDNSEFGEVAESFNAMSVALQTEREKTDRYIEQLYGLYKVTISFYDIIDIDQSLQDICSNISSILKARQTMLILRDEQQNVYRPAAFATEPSGNLKNVVIPVKDIVEMYQLSDGKPIIMNDKSAAEQFSVIAADTEEKNAIAAWMVTKENIIGIIRVSSKQDHFSEEDLRLLVILASHMSVAMENAELYNNLQDRMIELRETQEQLIQSAKLAAIGELASNVAHEINNPLTSIIGFTELAKEDDDLEAIRKSLDIIEKESLRARDIVKQLLNFARKKPLNLTGIKINDIVAEVVLLSSSQTRMNKVSVKEEYGDLPDALGDADQLKQVFLNIITNAIHAMPGGGQLGIKTSLMGEYILISFIDTGHGIPAEVKKRLFEPFFTTKKEKGTGLGLSISYRIIQDHGGRIDVESEEGRGTTFVVRLPVKH